MPYSLEHRATAAAQVNKCTPFALPATCFHKHPYTAIDLLLHPTHLASQIHYITILFQAATS